jgi:hypothetical protein
MICRKIRLSGRGDHPAAAATEFVAGDPDLILEQPAWPFNESDLTEHHPFAGARRSRK